MSRGDFGSHAVSSQGGRDGDTEYVRLCNSIGNNIQQLSINITQLQRLVDKIGTKEDVPTLPEKIQRTIKTSEKLAKDTSSYLKQLGFLEGDSPQEKKQRRLQQERLRENFSTTMNKLQIAMRRAAEKEKDSVSRARAASVRKDTTGLGDTSDDRSTFMSHGRDDSQVQVQEQDEVNLDLIEERERAIRELESDILDVNEIFRDLATMVHEQGEMIDSIEANVESTAVHVDTANVQLEKARDYQKASRKKMCIILVILVIVAAVLGIIIWQATN